MPRRTYRSASFRPIVLAYAALAVVVAPFLFTGCQQPAPSAGPGEYLFCFWNVENLFDDQFDNRTRPGDKEFDPWHARNPDILKQKLDKLTEVLLKMNAGKGPDILAICEVESVRAAELLKDALNARLPQAAVKYEHVLMKEVNSGRHIAPAIITRLPVIADRTHLLNKRLRILEAHLQADGKELVILASHWSSRLRDDSDEGRGKYADLLYGRANALFKANPAADVLICGDFNDNPDDVSVAENLHALGDRKRVAEAKDLVLLNLMAGKDPTRYGTHYYSGWMIFDQIVVAPGMLDGKGWSCDPDSVEALRTLVRPGDRVGRPWRFGGEKEKQPRGYSDHFPVTVKLKVQP